MKAIDVTTDLAALFPFHFADQSRAEARLRLYGEALAPVEGKRLETAYRRTMAAWTDRSPPLPGHILENLPALDQAAVPDRTGAMDDREIEAVMTELVASSLGREIVEQGLAPQLEDFVRQRKVSGLGQLSRALVARLREAEAKFEDGVRNIDGNGPFAETLTGMANKIRNRAERCDAKWRARLAQTQGAA